MGNYKVIPFSLEKATKDNVYTRRGIQITDWHYFETIKTKQQIVYIDEEGDWESASSNGFYFDNEEEHYKDLVIHEPTQEVVMWGNVFKEDEKIQNFAYSILLYRDKDVCDGLKNLNGFVNQVKAIFVDGELISTEKL